MTRVDGSDAAVIQSIKACPPEDNRFRAVSNIHPLLASSDELISRNLIIAQLAASVKTKRKQKYLLIDWCLMPTLAIFQLYSGIKIKSQLEVHCINDGVAFSLLHIFIDFCS